MQFARFQFPTPLFFSFMFFFLSRMKLTVEKLVRLLGVMMGMMMILGVMLDLFLPGHGRVHDKQFSCNCEFKKLGQAALYICE